MNRPPADETILHASCVALDGRGVLILGASGAGKSALALNLMALGARLVADDRCQLTTRDGALIASAPPALRGLIEARQIGILRAEPLAEAAIALAVDLDQTEPDRLPPRRRYTALCVTVDLVLGRGCSHLSASILLHLRGGRHA